MARSLCLRRFAVANRSHNPHKASYQVFKEVSKPLASIPSHSYMTARWTRGDSCQCMHLFYTDKCTGAAQDIHPTP